jgi:hypothetical protein
MNAVTSRALVLIAALAAFPAPAAAPPEKTFDLAIVRGALPAAQRVLRVEKDDAVRLRVTADAPGVLHLHGYRLEAKLEPGAPSEVAFKGYATGRYALEWHGAGETAAGSSHHRPPLAYIEVRPK